MPWLRPAGICWMYIAACSERNCHSIFVHSWQLFSNVCTKYIAKKISGAVQSGISLFLGGSKIGPQRFTSWVGDEAVKNHRVERPRFGGAQIWVGFYGKSLLKWMRTGGTWWLIPLSKWVTTLVINGISRLNPLITGVITHLLSGMNHQVPPWKPPFTMKSDPFVNNYISWCQIVNTCLTSTLLFTPLNSC